MRRIRRKNIKETGKSTDKFHLIFEGKISRNGTIDECINNNALIVIASLRHSHYLYIVYVCCWCYANK